MQMRSTHAIRRLFFLLVGTTVVISAAPALADDDPLPTEVEFRRMVEALKKAGEPTTPKDLQRPPVPAEQNAVTHLRKALALSKHDDPRWDEVMDGTADLRELDVDALKLREFLSDLPAIEAHLQHAMACPTIDWGLQYDVPAYATLLSFLNPLRGMANYRAAATSIHRADGDHRAIVRRIRETLFLARAADAVPTIVGHLVSIGIERMANRSVAMFSPILKIGSAATDASRDQVQALIRLLLDDGPSREGLRNAYRGERVMQIEVTELMATRKLRPSQLTGLVDDDDNAINRKMDALALIADHWVSGRLMLEHSGACLKAVDSVNWIDAQQALPSAAVPEGQHQINGMLARMLAVGGKNVYRQHYLGSAERRLAGTALAIRIYAVDHDGRLPGRLQHLIQKYLPRVPTDPMTADKPLQYDPEKAIVYAVGRNERDDGGREEDEETTEAEADLVFRLGKG